MNIFEKLNTNLLKQHFAGQAATAVLTQCQWISATYAKVENAISVLSDLKNDKSYIYTGQIATELGIAYSEEMREIDSIWEDDIFSKIHPDHLVEKHLMELKFFHLMKGLPLAERCDYQVNSYIRMRNSEEDYIPVQHRMFYLHSNNNGSINLALCLYNFGFNPLASDKYQGTIINTRSGKPIVSDNQQLNNILSFREKELLQLVKDGKSSKEIASLLSISINTVNRHRQNILEKLHVKNSFEACRIAEAIELL
jgi:DNA-binding CsgD family transcriptional regulator